MPVRTVRLTSRSPLVGALVLVVVLALVAAVVVLGAALLAGAAAVGAAAFLARRVLGGRLGGRSGARLDRHDAVLGPPLGATGWPRARPADAHVGRDAREVFPPDDAGEGRPARLALPPAGRSGSDA